MYSLFLIILVCFCHDETLQTLHTVLRLQSNSSIGMFDLWNMTNVSCGNDSVDSYRYGYIDVMNVSCIKGFYLHMGSPSTMSIKYTELQSSVLENILAARPNWVEPDSLKQTMSTNKQFVNYFDYEFLYLNETSDVIYFGIYNNESANDGREFVYSPDGVPFTANVHPRQFSGIYISEAAFVSIAVHDNCVFESQANHHYTTCQVKPVVSSNGTYMAANEGSTQILDCCYSPKEGEVEVNWFLRKNQEIVKINISLEYKYAGGTPVSPSLVIYSVTSTDEGLYYCQVQNVGGTSIGPDVELSVIQYTTTEDTCPCLCTYSDRLDYWSKQNKTNYTTEEWREILTPVIERLQAEIKVDTTKLSSTVYKHKSAPDARTSSKSMGILGILLLTFIFGSIVLSDIMIFVRQTNLIKRIAVKLRLLHR